MGRGLSPRARNLLKLAACVFMAANLAGYVLFRERASVFAGGLVLGALALTLLTVPRRGGPSTREGGTTRS